MSDIEKDLEVVADLLGLNLLDIFRYTSKSEHWYEIEDYLIQNIKKTFLYTQGKLLFFRLIQVLL